MKAKRMISVVRVVVVATKDSAMETLAPPALVDNGAALGNLDVDDDSDEAGDMMVETHYAKLHAEEAVEHDDETATDDGHYKVDRPQVVAYHSHGCC